MSSKPTIIPFASPVDALRNMPKEQYDPYDGITDEEALRRMRSPEFVTAMSEASEEISPDPIGCEQFFLSGFITEEMAMEFPLIARDFLSHVYREIPSFWVDIYGSDSPRDGYSFSFLNQKILNMMYLAAKGTGSNEADEKTGTQIYAIDLFRNLYRSYHRKEYLALKKYSSITVADVFAIAVIAEPSYSDVGTLATPEAHKKMIDMEREMNGGMFQMAAFARIMIMAGFLGITLKPECKYIYKILFDAWQEMEEAGRKGSRLFTENAEDDLIFEEQLSIQERRLRKEAKKLGMVSLPEGYVIPEKIMEESRRQVQEWLQECTENAKPNGFGMTNPLDSEKMSSYMDADAFISDVLNYYGYDHDYIIRNNYHHKGVERELIKTLALLNWRQPGRKHSFEEVQLFSLLMSGACALVGQMGRVDEYLDCMFGIDDRYYEWKDSRRKFKPGNTGSVKAVDETKVKISAAFDERKDEKSQGEEPQGQREKQQEKNLMVEIERLREKTHRQEKEIQRLYSMYSEAKDKTADYRERQENYEDDLKELQALREHVYKYTEEDETIVPDVEDMERAVAEKKIVIIGGRDSWAKRLGSRFYGWRFISTEVSGIVDLKIFDGADYTYFFTDYLAHRTYTAYVKTLRERGLKFGYIHSTNVEKNIAQIYEDTCAE
ncbi:MAG: hypothetical protein LIP11_01635 [Clostridiales bacterium]|nr:hypothetical protein [Clostridiales bacterium]